VEKSAFLVVTRPLVREPLATHIQRLLMPYAVEMYFDEASTARIRELWKRLAEIGLSSMTDCGARPHISLAVCEQMDIHAASVIVDGFSAGVPPFQISLASYGMFPGAEYVVFLAPKVTPQLLARHASFHESIPKAISGLWLHYAPEQWMPHCTLATRVPLERVGEVMESLRDFDLPMPGQVTSIGIVELRPVRLLHEITLR
jgi:2'-5' RNA ligase